MTPLNPGFIPSGSTNSATEKTAYGVTLGSGETLARRPCVGESGSSLRQRARRP